MGVIISIAPFFASFLANWLLDGEPLRKRFFGGFAAALTGIIRIGLNGNFVLKLNPVGDIDVYKRQQQQRLRRPRHEAPVQQPLSLIHL